MWFVETRIFTLWIYHIVCKPELSEALSHAMLAHPRWMGHSGELWQNVVHWRRKWLTTPAFLLQEPHEQHEKAQWCDTGRSAPQAGRMSDMLLGKSGVATERTKWLGQRRNSALLWMSGGESKVQSCKEQYCLGTWNVRSMNQNKLIGRGQAGGGKSEHWHLRNQWTKMDGNGWI